MKVTTKIKQIEKIKIYNQIEIDEDVISGEQDDEPIFKNEDTSWAQEMLNKNKTTLRSITAEENNEIMSLQDEVLQGNHDSGLKKSFKI